eukprot:TRINITY_DN64558_c0_g1_i1.p1 TRINITY_DN64558_c0_g1~~TRINITY_DN64558_c0_g1_i1.p1  ORF type:complete len:207 (+),score=18.53 TRINITY_DN64558_c0_g1_i1:53-622(+)
MAQMATCTTGGYGMRGISIGRHISDGSGRDWYIFGDSKLRGGRRTPPPKPFARSDMSAGGSTGSSAFLDLKRRQRKRSSQARSPRHSGIGRLDPGILERWRQHDDAVPGARNGRPLCQTPVMLADPLALTVTPLGETPHNSYTYFSDSRTDKRIGYSKYVQALEAAVASGDFGGLARSSLRASMSAPSI